MSDTERQYAVRYLDETRPGEHTQRVSATSSEQAAFEFGRMWQEGIAYRLTLVDVVELGEPEPAEDPLAVRERELARLRIRARWGDQALDNPDATVGRGRTAADVEQLRARGGEVILAPPGQDDDPLGPVARMALYGSCEFCGAARATRTVTTGGGRTMTMYCPACGRTAT